MRHGLFASCITIAGILAAGFVALAAYADVEVSGTIEDVRRAQLEILVARDQERLKELLSTPREPEAPPLHDDPKLRELAQRLPQLQRELRHLVAREKREASKPSN